MPGITQAITFAKANPNDPRSVELRKRMESGQLNPELQAAGLRTFDIPQPDLSKVDIAKAFEGVDTKAGEAAQSKVPTLTKKQQTEADIEASKADVREDVARAGKGLVSDFTERGQNVIDIFKSEQNPFSKGFQLVGQVAGGAVDIAERTVEAAITAATPQTVETAVIEKAKALLDTPLGQSAAEAISGGLEKWNKFAEKNPGIAANLEAAFNVVELLTIGVGGPIASRAAKKTVEAVVETAVETVKPVVKEVTEKVIETGKEVVTEVGKKVDEVQAARKQARIEKLDTQVDDAVGRIIQGKPGDIEQARRALSNIDTTDVKTFIELNERITDNIGSLSRKIDTELDKFPDPISADEFKKITKVGDETVTQNPIGDALDGLENAYKLSGELPNATRIAQLRKKLETDGLTLKEANNLAREYGIEFKSRAFSKLGEPKAGFNAENFENVRKGVKDVLRDKMPNDVTKALDSQISDLFSTRSLTTKMEIKVNQLFQKVKKRGLFKRIAQKIGTAVDIATFGTVSGFVSRLLPSNVGLKTMNALDIEEELVKNLKKIDSLGENATDDQIVNAMAEIMKANP